MILRYNQGMNTHPEPIDPNRPAVEDIAREVLMRDAEADAIDDRVGYDASSSLYVENGWSAPALARAVARVAALADRLENEAAYEASRGDTWDATCIRAEARRIRRALNGDDQ